MRAAVYVCAECEDRCWVGLTIGETDRRTAVPILQCLAQGLVAMTRVSVYFSACVCVCEAVYEAVPK